MEDDIIELAKELMKCYEKMYDFCYCEVDRIIRRKVTDAKLIENILDKILDIYTEKGFYLFIKLLLYYRTINPINANAYLQIMKEQREEEYNDLIKKYQKTK